MSLGVPLLAAAQPTRSGPAALPRHQAWRWDGCHDTVGKASGVSIHLKALDMKTKLSLLLAVSTLTFATNSALAHGNEEHAAVTRQFDPAKAEAKAFGQQGDPKKVTRVINLSMADTMRFTPDDVVVKKGETVKFLVRNDGKVLHEMVLGTPQELKAHAELMRKFPEMEHSEANMAHVKPSMAGEIVWQFTKAGEFQFACLLPGHFESGMVGSVTVQ